MVDACIEEVDSCNKDMGCNEYQDTDNCSRGVWDNLGAYASTKHNEGCKKGIFPQ